jgi:hypothetical protein
MKLRSSSTPRMTAKPKRPRRFLAAPSLGQDRPTRVYSLAAADAAERASLSALHVRASGGDRLLAVS